MNVASISFFHCIPIPLKIKIPFVSTHWSRVCMFFSIRIDNKFATTMAYVVFGLNVSIESLKQVIAVD